MRHLNETPPPSRRWFNFCNSKVARVIRHIIAFASIFIAACAFIPMLAGHGAQLENLLVGLSFSVLAFIMNTDDALVGLISGTAVLWFVTMAKLLTVTTAILLGAIIIAIAILVAAFHKDFK